MIINVIWDLHDPRRWNKYNAKPQLNPDLVGVLLYNKQMFVGLPGLEPGISGPESEVLPLHHSPIKRCLRVQRYKLFQKAKWFPSFISNNYPKFPTNKEIHP